MSDFQENITERIRQFYIDDSHWTDCAQELLEDQADIAHDGCDFEQSPLRDAQILLARAMKNEFESTIYDSPFAMTRRDFDNLSKHHSEFFGMFINYFPNRVLWHEILMTVTYYIDWPEIALCLLGDHTDLLAEVPALWYDALTPDQHAILMWADNTSSLYSRKYKLEKTHIDGIAEGWFSWIHDAYEDYRAHCDDDPDSVTLNFEAMRELAYYCETRALFRS